MALAFLAGKAPVMLLNARVGALADNPVRKGVIVALLGLTLAGLIADALRLRAYWAEVVARNDIVLAQSTDRNRIPGSPSEATQGDSHEFAQRIVAEAAKASIKLNEIRPLDSRSAEGSPTTDLRISADGQYADLLGWLQRSLLATPATELARLQLEAIHDSPYPVRMIARFQHNPRWASDKGATDSLANTPWTSYQSEGELLRGETKRATPIVRTSLPPSPPSQKTAPPPLRYGGRYERGGVTHIVLLHEQSVLRVRPGELVGTTGYRLLSETEDAILLEEVRNQSQHTLPKRPQNP